MGSVTPGSVMYTSAPMVSTGASRTARMSRMFSSASVQRDGHQSSMSAAGGSAEGVWSRHRSSMSAAGGSPEGSRKVREPGRGVWVRSDG